MSIYKDNPSLSKNFQIEPFESVFTAVTEKYRVKVLDNEECNFSVSSPSILSFHPDFNTIEKRLYGKLANRFVLLGRSNTQHNSGLAENADTQST